MSESSGNTASEHANADTGPIPSGDPRGQGLPRSDPCPSLLGRATCPTCGRPISAAQAPSGIGSLRPNTTASFEATVLAVDTAREVVTARGPNQVADATLQDGTGRVKFVLWGEQVVKYRPGQRVKLSDAWVSEFRGKLQVSLGRGGSAVVLGP